MANSDTPSVVERAAPLGVSFPKVLLPPSSVDYHRWSVIACDQYTSEPDYWREVEQIVGDKPSTLRLMLPEVYIGAEDLDARLDQIAHTTKGYLDSGVLVEQDPAPVLVVRETGSGRRRVGLLLAFDLEHYEFTPEARTPIRPTEETIVERLPPRVRIRSASPAEFPHILILVDDRAGQVVDPIYEARDKLTLLYETELMLGGGFLRGYAVQDELLQNGIVSGLEECLARAKEESEEHPLLFAVGDGNHSLATAKRVWEEAKAAGAPPNHPSRWAMAELISLYEAGLVFEPIHRIVAGRPADELLREIREETGAGDAASPEDADPLGERTVRWVTSDGTGSLILPGGELPGVQVQRAVESLSGVWVDYIHGDESLGELIHEHQGLGILMPSIAKQELFPLVTSRGALPRKMFSLGEASEKRYYVEGRSIC